MDRLKLWISALGGIVSAYIGAYLPIIGIVFAAVMFDIITGVAAAIYTGSGLSSKKATKGAIKKAMLFLSLGFGIFLDFLLPMAASRIGLTPEVGVMFSSVIAFYIAFSECVSVCENIYRCNPSAFPKWLAKLLSDSKDSIDKGEKI